MSAEPVAWMYKRDGGKEWASTTPPTEYGPSELSGNRISFIPLYAQSPAQARAMAIAEAASQIQSVANRGGTGSGAYFSGWEEACQYALSNVRALSSPPSVTEEWVNMRIEDAYDKTRGNNEGDALAEDAVRATLAALGVTVEGAAK